MTTFAACEADLDGVPGKRIAQFPDCWHEVRDESLPLEA